MNNFTRWHSLDQLRRQLMYYRFTGKTSYQ